MFVFIFSIQIFSNQEEVILEVLLVVVISQVVVGFGNKIEVWRENYFFKMFVLKRKWESRWFFDG